MKKAQSLIIQFILFFIIGFGLFLTTGLFFKSQSDMFRADVLSSSLELTNSYLSSAFITLTSTCKQCDFIKISKEIENTTAGYILEFDLVNVQPKGLNVSTENDFFFSSVHNLNESFDMTGSSLSAKTIILTFSRTKNELRIE